MKKIFSSTTCFWRLFAILILIAAALPVPLQTAYASEPSVSDASSVTGDNIQLLSSNVTFATCAFCKYDPIDGATDISTSPTLFWQTESNPDSYEYCYDTTDDDNCDSNWVSTGSDTSVSLSDLDSNITYYWQVRSVTGTDYAYADESTWYSFTTIASPTPGAFSKSDPSDGGSDIPTSLALSWETSSDAAGYEYCYDTTDDGDCDDNWISTGSDTSVSLSGLDNGTIYYWQVRATGTGFTYADAGTWWSFTTIASAPGAFGKSDPFDSVTDVFTSPTLSWAASSDATGYEYCYDMTNDGDCDGDWASTGSDTSVSLSELDEGTTYYWQVRATGTEITYADAGNWWSFTTITFPAAVSNQPILVAPEDGTELLYNRPTFDWEDVSGATGYVIQISKSKTFQTTAINTTVVSSEYTPSADLAVDATLYWRVRITDGTTWSETWSLITAFPPKVPALISPSNSARTNDYTPTLDWKNSSIPSGAPAFDHYRLQVDDDDDFSSPVIDKDIAGISKSSYTPTTPLSYNTKFYWRVNAYNVEGEYSAWSAVRVFYTFIGPPKLLTPSNGSSSLSRRPVFDWDDAEKATQYKIQISKKSTFSSPYLIGSYMVSSSTYTPTSDLPAGKTIYWRVQSRNPSGASGWSEVYSFTAPKSPSIPKLSSPSNNSVITDYTPTLNWSNSTIASGAPSFRYYWLQVADSSEFTNLVIDKTINGITNSQYTIPVTLSPNAKFYWRVSAYNVSGEYSTWSTVYKFRTAIAPPTLLSPDDGETVTTRKPTLIWTRSDGASSYTIQVSKSSKFTILVCSKTGYPYSSYTCPNNLPTEKTLYWRVRAIGQNGPSAWSEVYSFYIPDDNN